MTDPILYDSKRLRVTWGGLGVLLGFALGVCIAWGSVHKEQECKAKLDQCTAVVQRLIETKP